MRSLVTDKFLVISTLTCDDMLVVALTIATKSYVVYVYVTRLIVTFAITRLRYDLYFLITFS